MTKDELRKGLPFATITALLLCVSTLAPLAAHAEHAVAVFVVNTQGQPLPLSPVVLLNADGLVGTTGKTDEKGRYCLAIDSLEIGKQYSICALQADNSTGPCTKGVASETDCAAALLALGTTAPKPAADAHTATEVLGTGLGAGAVGAGIAVPPSGGSGSAGGQPESALKAVVAPPTSKKK